MDKSVVYLTGANGFIGRNLVKLLEIAGVNVVPLNRDSIRSQTEESKRQLLEGQATHKWAIHLAAASSVSECQAYPTKAFDTNVLYTVEMLDFAKSMGCHGFIFASTGLVYQPSSPDNPAHESFAIDNGSIYVSSKLAAELAVQSYANTHHLPAIILRLSNVYGPGMKEDTVMGFILRQLNEQTHSPEKTLLIRDTRPSRDYINVTDVSRAIKSALTLLHDSKELKDGLFCKIFNISTKTSASVQLLIDEIKKCLINNPIQVHLSGGEKHPVKHSCLDNQAFIKATGWSPNISIQDGIRAMVEADLREEARI